MIQLIERLPSSLNDLRGGEKIPKQLYGATILRMGTFPRGSNLRGGGLGIEYHPAGSRLVRRIVFEFDEREMHIHSDEVISENASADRSLK
jgi:hypothetical protein